MVSAERLANELFEFGFAERLFTKIAVHIKVVISKQIATLKRSRGETFTTTLLSLIRETIPLLRLYVRVVAPWIRCCMDRQRLQTPPREATRLLLQTSEPL
jgi:hypothetical protein